MVMANLAAHFACANKHSFPRVLAARSGHTTSNTALSHADGSNSNTQTQPHVDHREEKRSRGRSTCLTITTALKSPNPSPSGRTQELRASKHEAGVTPQGGCWTCSTAGVRGIKCTPVAFIFYKVIGPQRP